MTNETAKSEKVRMAHFIGRCPRKGCTVRHHIDVPLKAVTRYDRGIIGVPGSARPYTVWVPVWQPYNVLMLHCAAHKWAIEWRQIDGRYSAEHVCDARCMNATGHNCECSCGGANHGRAHNIG